MEWINEWLISLTKEQGEALYSQTGTVCLVALLVSIALYTWRMKLHPLKAIAISALAYLFVINGQYLVTWYIRDFALDNYVGTANAGYGILLLPLLAWLCARLFNMPYGTVGELMAVTTLSWHFFGRFGCTFPGCCFGIACDWGLYSYHAEHIHFLEPNRFPVCWLECLVILGILLFLILRIHRRAGAPDNGKALAYTLLIYGSARCVTEFLRWHQEFRLLFGVIPDLCIAALAMALVGGVLLFLIIRKEREAKRGKDTLPTLKGKRR